MEDNAKVFEEVDRCDRTLTISESQPRTLATRIKHERLCLCHRQAVPVRVLRKEVHLTLQAFQRQ